VPTFGSQVLILDADDGAIQTRTDVPKPWHSSVGGLGARRDVYASPVSLDDAVVIVCAEHVLCLEPDGGVRWARNLGSSLKASPAWDARAGLVIAAGMNGSIWWLDSDDGADVGQIKMPAQIRTSPSVFDGAVRIGCASGEVWSIENRTRNIQWVSPLGAPRDYTSSTILPDGGYLATAESGNMIALRGSDGSFLWESTQVIGLAEHNPAMNITPVVSPDGWAYCASYDGDLYSFKFRD